MTTETTTNENGSSQHVDGELVRELDGLIGVLSGLGYAGNDQASSTVMVRSRPIRYTEAWAYYIWDPIARGEIDRIWDDGIRAPWDLTGEDRKYDWRSIESQCADLRVVSKGGLAGKYGDLLGAAFVIPDIVDGLDPSMPLDLKAIRKIRRLHVVTCERLLPKDFDDALGSDVTASPRSYTLMMPLEDGGQRGRGSNSPTSMDGREIHHTRVWRFNSEELPPIENFGSNGYPPSKLSRLKLALDAYNTANMYTLNAMNTVSVMAMKIEGLRQMACTPEGQATARELLKSLRWSIDNLRVLPLDMENEDYVEVRRNVDGFAKMSDVAKGWVLAASERPKLILWGEQPAGLNADSRGEVRSWYDQCEVHRRDKFEPFLNWMLRLIFAARANAGEAVPSEWTIKWEPLMSPAPDQIASQAQQWAACLAPLVINKIITPEEAHATLVDHGVISPLVKAEDPTIESPPGDPISTPQAPTPAPTSTMPKPLDLGGAPKPGQGRG